MQRKLPVLFLIAALLLAMLAGCGTTPIADETPASLADEAAAAEDAAADTPAEEAAAPAESVGIAWQSQAGMNPFTSESVTNQAIFSLLYEQLFTVSSSFEAAPLLCETCAVSEDNTVWHFDLRQNVTFSDGSAMTASDVLASLQAAQSSTTYQSRFSIVTGMEQDGTYGIVIRLSTACESLPLLLDIPIVKAGTVSSDAPIGSGPFARSGDTLVRTAWWQNTEPTVNAQEIRLISAESPQAVRDAFEFSDVEIAYTDPSASNTADYHCDYELWSVPSTVMLYLGFNQTSNYFYSNTLRAGVTYAVDRETILSEDYGGFGSIATLPCSPLSAYYDAGLASSYAYSPDSFQYSLSTSGILPDASQPVRLLVSNTSAKRIAAANRIASKLTELGLYTEVTSSSEDEFLYALQTGNFDLYLSEIRLAPNFDLRCFFTLYGSAAYGGIGGDAALQYCDQALENSGNYYDLCRTVVGRGLICPILFRSNALYSARGVVSAHSVSLSNFFAAQPEQSLTDILSETPYQPSAPVTEEDGNTPADGDDTTPTEGDTPEPTGDLPADSLPEDSSAPDGEAPIE